VFPAWYYCHMSKIWRLITIYALILSPLWVDLIASRFVPAGESNLSLRLIETIGVGIIALLGVIVSVLFRKKPNANTISIYAYAIPAVLVCCYVIWRILISSHPA
jgi:cytochrome c oxidase subunit IV